MAALLVAVCVTAAPAAARPQDRQVETGRAIEAAFGRESYRPSERASLRFWSAARNVAVQVFRVGPERVRTVGRREMQGVAMTAPRHLESVRAGTRVEIGVGEWPSGLYFARLAAGQSVGYAPFVVAPSSLGQSRVAVALPTRTWQAYNLRDDDGDGRADTWYADRDRRSVRLVRPFLDRGVPRYYARYELPFLHWLQRTGRAADVLSQADLDAATGDELASAYDLIVFPGHHEYVTDREYRAITRYRDLGGNLAFLSANSFFWRIDVRDGVITRIAEWRDLGRPESALIGIQYLMSDDGALQAPWVVRTSRAGRWLFAGTGLRPGSSFAKGGVEIDATTDASPQSLEVVAEIPDLFGPGRSAQMTYYESTSGARVFAAGAFMLTRSLSEPRVQRLLTNLWRHLTVDEPFERLPPTALRGQLHRLDQYPSLRLATREQRRVAMRFRGSIRAAATMWRDRAAAWRNGGFRVRRPHRPTRDTAVLWYHAWHRGRHDDRSLDPKRPDALVYADVPGYPLVLVGVMYYMPRGVRGPTPAGPIIRWHWHRDCVERRGRALKPRANGTCAPDTRSVQSNEMMHVWFTRDLRSAYALHAPVHELCRDHLLPSQACEHIDHGHG